MRANSCLGNVKVCDSWGTFCLYTWMTEHHVQPKLDLKYNESISFSINVEILVLNVNSKGLKAAKTNIVIYALMSAVYIV